MQQYVLSFKPAIDFFGSHDPSAALFRDGELVYGAEEERFTRVKHAKGTFPKNAIQACLAHEGITLSDVDKIVLPYDPELAFKKTDVFAKRTAENFVSAVTGGDDSSTVSSQSSTTSTNESTDADSSSTHPFFTVTDTVGWGFYKLKRQVERKYFPVRRVEKHLEKIDTPVPPIECRSHHLCHAVGAFHPSGFDEALVLTADGEGEYDCTVVWHGTEDGLERIRTDRIPNSLGHFFGGVTEYIGYRANNGEGKVMGLAPYGERNHDIERKLRSIATFGLNYDVTEITRDGLRSGADVLEELFDRPRNPDTSEFDTFEKDLAFTAQYLLEETVTEIVDHYVRELGVSKVCFNGGVALNCKLNKRIMELDSVDELFIQPVAHDGGLALGGGWIDYTPSEVEPMTNVYWGERPDVKNVEQLFESNKITYEKVDDVATYTAERIADGALIGWVQGRQEMGPRALGNRSIIADPRTAESRDRVNKYVKHREEWRPFAPSMLESAAEKYLVNGGPSPYMIKTFDTDPEHRDEIEAVIHPGDETTRPQTVREDQNKRYFDLISAFEDITGVPVVLNTSFNDHGEPIVTTAHEALSDFYTMGLDVLVVGDYVVEKSEN